MAKLIKRILSPILIPLAKRYVAKDRSASYKGIKVQVKSGVFHPLLFFSTKILVNFIMKQHIENQTLLELGAGSALVAIAAAQKGAIVTASDMSSLAIDNIKQNALINKVNIEVIHSDLFEAFAERTFDWIIINPPYYPKKPQQEAEYAWYCGENFEYFQRLFEQLPHFIHPKSKVIMILSEDCEIERIKKIAEKNHLKWQQIAQKTILWEKNYLFEINLSKYLVNST